MLRLKQSTRFLQKMKILLLHVIVGFTIIQGFHPILAQKSSGTRSRNYGQTPIGAHRIFPKTTFSCLGRPAGYYADIETGCQVYHMCDGLGRQFSYSCPNTTLFQQRMLICDHWYMVNCSKAESDYAANLLIGQRDKPFVPEDENQLRTPRPDLLDRPYAPDYSGESFRNHYKTHQQISNEITDSDDTSEKQYFQEVNSPSPTRWHLPTKTKEVQSLNSNIVRRYDVVNDNIAVDLGTSYSSNYNSTGDFSVETENSSIPLVQTTTVLPITTTTQKLVSSTPYIKPPSRLYEPPFLYPIYNLDYTKSSENQRRFGTTSTNLDLTTIISTTSVPRSTVPPFTTTETIFTTQRPTLIPSPTTISKSSIFSGRPFSLITTTTLDPQTQFNFNTKINSNENSKTFTQSNIKTGNYVTKSINNINTQNTIQSNKFDTRRNTTIKYATTTKTTTTTTDKSSIDVTTPFLDLLPPFDRLSQPSPFKIKTASSEAPTPSTILLPPFQNIFLHDVATTQGPPIYFEWKIPSNGLEPPKFDPPTGLDSNQNINTSTASQNYTVSSPFSHNFFLAPIFDQQSTQSSIKTPTARSIPKTTTVKPFSNLSTIRNEKTTVKKSENSAEIPKEEINYHQLQKDLLIPDYLFPLENDARISYDQSDLLNSFQLKIPDIQNNNKPWYGENPKCPDCHPSFVKPGTCEPCIRI